MNSAVEKVVVPVAVALEHRLGQLLEVSRGGQLGLVGQARGVLEGGVVEAEFLGLGGHLDRELGLGAAELLGEDHSDVIG